MHEAEVVESDLVDTNLVGCLDSKALIVTANSYEEVRESSRSRLGVHFFARPRTVLWAGVHLVLDCIALVRPGASC